MMWIPPDLGLDEGRNKGNMPKYLSNGEPQNGGIPQNGSLEVHLARYRVSLAALIPEEDFEGVCMLDFEHCIATGPRNAAFSMAFCMCC